MWQLAHQRSLRLNIVPQCNRHKFVSIETFRRKFLLNLLSTASLEERYTFHALWMC